MRRLRLGEHIFEKHISEIHGLFDGTKGHWHDGTTDQAPIIYARNVKGDGAKGDNSTEDTTAIQAAIDAVNTAGGGVVYAPAGTYILQTLTHYSSVHIKGDGPNLTIFKLKNTSNVDLIKGNGFATLTGGGTTGGIHSWGLSDLTLDGNKANNATAGYGLRVYGYGFTLRNVTIKNCRNDGIYSEWADSAASPGNDSMEAFVQNVKVHDCAGNGITWAGPHDTMFAEILSFSNSGRGFNFIYSAGVYASSGSQLLNCHAWGNTQTYGYYFEAAVYCGNCVAEGASSAQVYITGNDVNWQGGTVFAAGASTPVGFEIAASAAGYAINTKVLNCTSGAIKYTADGGTASVRLLIWQTSGAAESGTPAATTERWIAVAGGATGAIGGVWTDWTPTVTQSASVSLTITEAKYALIGKVCHIYAKLVVTGSGTSGNGVKIGGQPTAAQPAVISGIFPVGTAEVWDNGTGLYGGLLMVEGATSFVIRIDGQGDVLGIAPAFGLAINDEILFSATYRVA